MNEKMYIELEGYDSLERPVKHVGGSGGVLVPKIWLGARVKVILLEDLEYYYKKEHKQREVVTKKLYKIYGYDTVTKTVKKSGNGAAVTVPIAWFGKMVKIILLEDLNKVK